MTEPKIQIGDYVLSEAQAMAVRVAITDFHMTCSHDEAFSEMGPIADEYKKRLSEVLKIIFDEAR